MEDAPTPKLFNDSESEIKDIQFVNQGFDVKLNNEKYIINVGTTKDALVIKATSKDIKNIYQSILTFEQLKNTAKAMRYFDDLKDIISFIENKGKKNEIFLKKEQNDLFIGFKVTSPNGKEEEVLLKLKPKEVNDKEIISLLLKKVDNLEKIISEHNNYFSKLFSEIELLKKQVNQVNKTDNEEYNDIIDSKIANAKDIDFIIKYLKESPVIKNKNFKFDLLYRGSRDGDDTVNVHKKCCGHKNVIIFMKSEEGNKYGGFSNIGWETRDKNKAEYPIDDNAFLFSLDNKKIFKAQKGRNKMCWINSDEYGLSFSGTLMFYNHFMTVKHANIGHHIEVTFIDCHKNDFNSGLVSCKFSELEVFKIN